MLQTPFRPSSPRSCRPFGRAALAIALAAQLGLTLGCGSAPASALAAASESSGLDALATGQVPAWLVGGVVYGVVPPMYGGKSPLRDVIGHLDELKRANVAAILLPPINRSDDSGAISYAITDFMGIRSDYGGEAGLVALVTAAHQRGMRVLMDFVPNHTSTQHPYYLDAQKNGRASSYWNFYQRDAQGNAQNYFDWANLKNLNYDNPAVTQHVTDALSKWVREAGVDGYRMDAAWGIKQRTPGFWPKLTQTLKAIKPDVFLLAEASARDPYYVKSGFAAAYDWTPDLGKWAWETAFDDPAQTGTRLHQALNAGHETPSDQVFRFLNNNDTGSRFITRHGLEQTRVAAVLLHTLPGIPYVYMGDEVGAAFSPYDDPAPLTGADPNHLRAFYQKLGQLRGSLPALRQGRWSEVAIAEPAPGVYAYMRDAGKQGTALVVLNFGAPTDVTLQLPGALAAHTGFWVDQVSGQPVAAKRAGAHMQLSLAPASALVLTPTPAR